VVKEKLKDTAFDGEGARRYGGRWNNPGKRMIYAAETASLALLELLVHIDSSLLPSYTLFPVDFDHSLVSTVEPSKLPRNWRTYPGPAALKSMGDEWLESLSSPVLKVPSVIVPHEWNYLFNPEHSKFSSLKIGAAVSLEMDPRLRGE
jgi:RES domain-containing protein